jgi:hypothetical protein
MRKRFMILALALAACQHVESHYQWKTLYYSVLGGEVMLWETPSSDECILGAGPREVIDDLRAVSRSGQAQLYLERLPAPKPLPPLPPGQIVFDRKVLVRGVPIEPQCDSSKELYWITEFRFVGPFPGID